MAMELKIDVKDGNETALDFLQRRIPAAPVSYLRQLLKKGKIVRGGEVVAVDSWLVSGEILVLPDSARLSEFLDLSARQPTPPVILYEDNQLLIVNKPPGLAVHAAQGHETVNLTQLLQERAEREKAPYRIAPAQRLDLETSGAVLFGKGRKALAALGQLVTDRQLKKTYLALVSGCYAGPQELISQMHAKGKLKEARLRLKLLATGVDASLLEIDLQTGRQHQIRRQLAEQGHPLCGDRRYQGPCTTEFTRLFLHSYQLTFHSPFGGEPIQVIAPLPQELQDALDAVKINSVF